MWINSLTKRINFGTVGYSSLTFISTIVKLCGQYVRIDWQRGLTEMQENIFDEQPYFVEKKERVVQIVVVDWNEIELDKESENNIEDEDMYK